MSAKPVVGVQGRVLSWARETANLSVTEVAEKLKKTPEIIEAWEEGASAPSYAQLEALAYDLYKRPLALFFLPAPPDEPRAQTEFRSLPAEDLVALDRDTVFLIRKARAFHHALDELYGGRAPAASPLWKEVPLSERRSIDAQAGAVRDALGVTLEMQRAWKDDDQALKEWRRRIEARGVFVFKHAFKQREISGFCLVDDELPLIMINNSTTKTRQIFSLVHELAHVLVRRSGISTFGEREIERLPNADREVERFCNAVAAEILVPSTDFESQAIRWTTPPAEADDAQYATLAERYHVSREVILRRFLDRGQVSREFYRAKTDAWGAQKAEKSGSGGNYYATQGAYLSETFVREVFSRYSRRLINQFDAAELIGLAPKNFLKFQDQVLQGAAG